MKTSRQTLVVVIVIALILNFGVAFTLGVNRPMESDSFYFLCIAKSLATGHGYMLTEGFWPDVPTMSRAPGWPFVVSLALRMAPGVNPDVVMRLLSCTLNAIAAVLVAMLAGRVIRYSLFVIGGGKRVKSYGLSVIRNTKNEQPITNNSAEGSPNNLSAIAGCIYAAYPVALYEAYEGTSEILFIVLALIGTLLIISAKAPIVSNWRRWLGFLVMGCAVLVRPNFITWIGFVGLLVIGYWLSVRLSPSPFRGEGWGEGAPKPANTPHPNPLPQGEREKDLALLPLPSGERVGVRVSSPLLSRPWMARVRGSLTRLFKLKLFSFAFCMTLFLVPSFFWAIRNYHVCGHFPVLSTLRGQTFYGGNNSVVANTLDLWGYWVFPNSIPGERPMYELSHTMSEQEVDVYYFDKGKAWVKSHWSEMPRLVLGKLVRAYVPIPWKPSLKSWFVAAWRWGIYVAGIAGILLTWRRWPFSLKLIFSAMVLSNVMTVVFFWGCARFAFELDPFLIPFAVLAVLCQMEKARLAPEQ